VTVVDTNAIVTLFSDAFSARTTLPPWLAQSGTWKISGGVVSGSAKGQGYGELYLTNSWTNYSVQAQVQFAPSAYGGGLGAYLNPSTGARYAAWIFPETSAGGSNVVRLLKFSNWKNYSYNNVGSAVMQQAALPGVGTNWHTVKLAISGTQLAVYYDSNAVIQTTDTEAAPYRGGGVSIDLRTSAGSDQMNVDNIVVTSIPNGAAPAVVLAPGIVVPDAPTIQSVNVVNGVAAITWTASPGSTYRLQSTTDLNLSDWQDASDDILATDSVVSATNEIGDAPKRFYRVVLVR